MRRLLCLLLLPVLLLAGCGSSSEPLDAVTVSEGEAGAAPDVEVDGDLSVEETVREVLREGDGAEVERGDQVTISYLGVNGRTGEVFDSSYGNDPPTATFTLDDSVISGFATGLDGVQGGARVLVAVSPQDGYGPGGGLPDAGIEADDTLLFVIDVQAVHDVLDRAQGQAAPPLPANLPTVELADDGEPSITLPEGVQRPSKLVVRPLIVGDGPVVEKGATVTVHYVGVTWPGGEVFDSSWERGTPAAFEIGTGQVIPGWDQGLVGKKVGSQLLLVVPPAQGYGTSGNEQAGISGTDTLVFVVDILAVAPTPTASQ